MADDLIPLGVLTPTVIVRTQLNSLFIRGPYSKEQNTLFTMEYIWINLTTENL